MREMEKVIRQVEKGGLHHAAIPRHSSEAALLSPTGRSESGRTTPPGRTTPSGRTGSGRTTPTGRLTPPGITHSGSATPPGRICPLGTASSGLTTPTGRFTPPGRTRASGRTTPPGMESGLTTPTGSVTPYGITTSSRSSPVGGISASEEAQQGGHIIASAAAAASASRLHDADNRNTDRAVAGSAAYDVRGDADDEVDSEGLVPRLLSSRSSVKDAVALWEVSHPVSSGKPSSGNRQLMFPRDGQASVSDDRQLPFGDRQGPIGSHSQLPFDRKQAPFSDDRQPPFGTGQASNSGGQPFTSHAETRPDAEGQATRPVTSQGVYQTRSLSEGVYGKLYSSKSSISHNAISAAWNDDAASAEHGIGSSGSGASGSGRHTVIRTGAAAGSGIGRFGSGIGRGSSKFAVDSKPEVGNLAADLGLVKQ